MKLELIKKTEKNGNVFYQVFKDDEYVTGTTVYAGDVFKGEDNLAYYRAVEIYNRVKDMMNAKIPDSEVMKSEEI